MPAPPRSTGKETLYQHLFDHNASMRSLMGAVSRPRRPLVYILIHQASVLLFGALAFSTTIQPPYNHHTTSIEPTKDKSACSIKACCSSVRAAGRSREQGQQYRREALDCHRVCRTRLRVIA